MSRQRNRIVKAAEAKGYAVTTLQWAPIGQMLEMMGREGGWFVAAERDGHSEMALGYNADDVIHFIDEFWDAGGVSTPTSERIRR